jgi:lysine 6-dehydrogenase
VDEYDRKTGLTSMMRTTAWPASIVLQMMANGVINKLGGIRQELDVPADLFLREMSRRGIRIRFAQSSR